MSTVFQANVDISWSLEKTRGSCPHVPVGFAEYSNKEKLPEPLEDEGNLPTFPERGVLYPDFSFNHGVIRCWLSPPAIPGGSQWHASVQGLSSPAATAYNSVDLMPAVGRAGGSPAKSVF